MDGTLLLGVAAAVAASVCYNGGLALQALDARAVPAEHSLRPSLLLRLVRRPRWLLGTALTVIGWPLQTAALLVAPLALVQPALAAGLILLLFIGHSKLGERVGAREIAGVGAIVLGVIGLTLAAPEHVSDQTDTVGLIIALAGLGVMAVLPYLIYHGKRSPGHFVALGAGFGYALSGITTKLVSDSLADGTVLLVLAWAAATGIGSGIAFLSEMTALQNQPATRVAPLVFTVQLLAPVLLAPVIVNESWSGTPLGGVVLLGFVLLVTVGAFIVASSQAVGKVVESTET